MKYQQQCYWMVIYKHSCKCVNIIQPALVTPLVAAAANSWKCWSLCWEGRDWRQWRWQWQGWPRGRWGVQHELGQRASQQLWALGQSWRQRHCASKCGDHQLRWKRPKHHMFPTLNIEIIFQRYCLCFKDYFVSRCGNTELWGRR